MERTGVVAPDPSLREQSASNRSFHFGPFALHVDRFELTRDGKAIDLPANPLQILIVILQQRGDLVTRAQIAQTIWPDLDPEDVTHRINTALNRIRAALGDTVAEPRYIQTVIGRGYRFTGQLEPEPVPPGPDAPTPAPVPFASVTLEVPVSDLPALRSSARQRGVRWVGLVLLAIFAAGALTLAHSRWIRTHTPVASPGRLLVIRQLTFNDPQDFVTTAAVAPDGQYIAYADADGIRLKATRAVGSFPLPTPAGVQVTHLAWFSDGRHLATIGVAVNGTESDLWVLSTDGGAPRLLRRDARQAAPAPAGGLLAFTDGTNTQLWVGDALTGSARLLLQNPADTKVRTMGWLPGGQNLLVSLFRGADSTPATPETEAADTRFSLLVVNAPTGQVTARQEHFRADQMAISNTGLAWFVSAQRGDTAGFRVERVEAGGILRNSPQLRASTPLDVSSVTLADDGTAVGIVRVRAPGVMIGDFSAQLAAITAVQPLTFSSNPAYPHAWTPDSREVYFEERVGNKYHLFRQEVGAHDAVPLLDNTANEAFPLPTPDQQWLLFLQRGRADEPWAWYRAPLKGGPPSRIPGVGTAAQIRCPVTGSSCVLRQADRTGAIQFSWLDPVRGPQATVLTISQRGQENAPWDLAPAGNQLVVVTGGEQHPALHVTALHSVHSRTFDVHLHDPAKNVHWTADARSWVVTTQTSEGSYILLVREDGTADLLIKTKSPSWADPSPDGRKIVFVDEHQDSNVAQLALTTAAVKLDGR